MFALWLSAVGRGFVSIELEHPFLKLSLSHFDASPEVQSDEDRYLKISFSVFLMSKFRCFWISAVCILPKRFCFSVCLLLSRVCLSLKSLLCSSFHSVLWILSSCLWLFSFSPMYESFWDLIWFSSHLRYSSCCFLLVESSFLSCSFATSSRLWRTAAHSLNTPLFWNNWKISPYWRNWSQVSFKETWRVVLC